MNDLQATAASGVAIVAGIVSLANGFKSFKQYRLVRDLPTSKVRSLAMGIAEVQGTARPIQTVIAPFSHTECIYVKYTVEEYRKSKKRSYWATIVSGDRRTPFLAKDDTGEVLVDPTGAEFQVDKSNEYLQDVGFLDSIGNSFDSVERWGKSDEEKLATVDLGQLKPVYSGGIQFYSTGDRRFREYCLTPGEELYILGTAAVSDAEGHQVEIRKGSNNPTYVIGDKTESEMLGSLKKAMWWKTGLAVVLIVIGLGMVLHHIGLLF